MGFRLDNVSVVRGGRAILEEACLAADAGRFVAFCGPNGAGKTTALSVLAGTIRPDRGRVTLDDVPLSGQSARALARRRAVLPQTPLLSFPFRVHEVVAMGRTPHEGRGRPQDDHDIIVEAMRRVDVIALAQRNYLTLSGGEKQRVHLARMLAQLWHPAADGADRWLLLDEPTAALDLKYQLRLVKLLRSLAGDGWGIIAVLHDLPLVKTHADRVVLFKNGRIAALGSPPDVLTTDHIHEVFDLDEPLAI
jgi:iron complex transport system ATP-binding protein